jgi:hypothetical protein
MGNLVDGICIRTDTEHEKCKKSINDVCQVYVRPDLAFPLRRLGGCPFHQPVDVAKKTKVNPLKASKRAKKGKS